MQNTAKQNYPNLVASYNTARKQGGLILQCSGAKRSKSCWRFGRSLFKCRKTFIVTFTELHQSM